MRHWLWLLSLPISLGLHVLALAAVVWMLSEETLSRVIFIDLNPPAATPPAPKPSRPAPQRVPRPAPRDTAPLMVDERSSAPRHSETPTTESRPESATIVEAPTRVNRAAPAEAAVPAPVTSAPTASTPVPPLESPGVVTALPHRLDSETSGGSIVATILPRARGGSGAGNGMTTGGRAENGAVDGRGRTDLAMSSPSGVGGEGDYGPYRTALRRRIQDVLRYPGVARRRGLSGTVELEILVQPTGAISDVAIVDSSSHRILDEAAMDAVRSLPPLPFPDGLTPRALRVRLPVVFELR